MLNTFLKYSLMLSAFLLSHFAFGATFKESADIVTKTYKVQLETSPFYTRDAAFKKIVDDAKDVCPFPNDYDKLNRCTELVIAGLEHLKTLQKPKTDNKLQGLIDKVRMANSAAAQTRMQSGVATPPASPPGSPGMSRTPSPSPGTPRKPNSNNDPATPPTSPPPSPR